MKINECSLRRRPVPGRGSAPAGRSRSDTPPPAAHQPPAPSRGAARTHTARRRNGATCDTDTTPRRGQLAVDVHTADHLSTQSRICCYAGRQRLPRHPVPARPSRADRATTAPINSSHNWPRRPRGPAPPPPPPPHTAAPSYGPPRPAQRPYAALHRPASTQHLTDLDHTHLPERHQRPPRHRHDVIV